MVTYVTSNHSQFIAAKARKLNACLYDEPIQGYNLKEKSKHHEQKVRQNSMAKAKKNEAVYEDIKQLKCQKSGKDTYIYTPPGVTVYDTKGKRRIASNGSVMIRLAERIVYDDKEYVEYIVTAINDSEVTMKKIS